MMLVAATPQVFLIVVGEDDAGDVLYNHTEEECDGHGDEYRHDDLQGLIRVNELSHRVRIGIPQRLYQCQGKCTAQQFEYHGDRGGGGQSHCVEHVQQDHVGQHHAQQDAHDLVEIEELRLIDAVSRNVHHAVTERRTDEYTDTGQHQHGFKRCRLGTDGRIEEVHRIVGYAYQQVEYRKDGKEEHDAQIHDFHNKML